MVKIITPPATEPVSLVEAKLHLRIDYASGPVVACATTNASATVTPASIYGILPGMSVSGAGIQSGTVVSSVGSATITLSKTATASAGAAVLTFTTAGLINEEDTLIANLISAAREYCEAYQNRAYVVQTVEMSYDKWPCFPVNLPRPPLISVTSIKYYDTANLEYTLAPANYFVDADTEPGRIALTHGVALPATALREIGAVKIRYTAGAAATVSVRVKQAMLLLIGHWYENRGAAGSVSKEIAFSVESLLSLDRVRPV